jgi:hypothetical protein
MALTLILALQAAAAAPASPEPPSRPRWTMVAGLVQEFALGNSGGADLARLAGAGTCLPAAGSEVMVCGPRRGGAGAYPLDYWARIFAPRPIRAEMGLGGNVQGRIYSEAVPMDRGAVSNRAMVGIRLPF